MALGLTLDDDVKMTDRVYGLIGLVYKSDGFSFALVGLPIGLIIDMARFLCIMFCLRWRLLMGDLIS